MPDASFTYTYGLRVGAAFVNNSADGLFGDPSNAHYIGDVMSVFLSCPRNKIYVGSKAHR